jgi:hypothetical protein
VRHGLTAETYQADYESFQATVISDYDAETAVERELVLRLAGARRRLRRASGIETALFDRIFSARTDIAEGFLHLSALPAFLIGSAATSTRFGAKRVNSCSHSSI